MLRELSVRNLALIEDARVELQPGYCAWTGETGAGKSLLLTALGLVLGGKAAADLVRSGKDEARAAAVFDLADGSLKEEVEAILGGPIDEDCLIVTRRISSSGRSQAHANGLPVAVATLRQLGERLIDVHGQHEGRALLVPDRQRDLLDVLFGRLGSLAETYRSRRLAYDELRRRREALVEAAHRREREVALLAFEREELTALDPRAAEYDELNREAHRLANVEEVRKVGDGRRLPPALRGRPLGPGASGPGRPPARTARPVGPRTGVDRRRPRSAGRGGARGRPRTPSPRRRLGKRPGPARRGRGAIGPLSAPRRPVPVRAGRPRRAVSGVVEAQLASLEREEADLRAIDGPLAEAWKALRSAASDLSAGRRKSCKAFAKSAQAHLKDLHLTEARLSVEVEPLPLGDDPGPVPPESGLDRVEILFAPNPGEAPRPLRKIASGGELSRVTLAIKTVLADVDRVPTLVFDEIDTGVGGRLGATLGRKIAALAERRQVLCVTHLPQMASFARHQWVIRKSSEKGRTRTTITPLSGDDRVGELAAMIRGESAAEGTRREALAMLAEARIAP